MFPTNVHPPIFGVMHQPGNGNNSNISLDDIFDEFLFANEQRDLVKNEGKSTNDDNKVDDYGDDDGGKDDYGDDDSFDGDGDGDGYGDDIDENGHIKKKKRSNRGQQRNMTEEQKVERRERNREHAKRSRVRKKFLLESLQQSVQALQDENEKLRGAIREHLPSEADELLSTCSQAGAGSIIADRPDEATKTLDDPDYSLVKALQTAQQNFVITDPSMPDNPIVFASQGFLNLTGYSLDKVLGRNCRFLQGPATDPRTVARIRAGIEKGEDTTTVILNYRADQTTFWNQFFVAALRDGEGNIVNYLGVQCKVSDDYAVAFIKHEQSDDRR